MISMMDLLTMVSLLGALIPAAMGHGRLIDPPSRSTMWRYGFKNPRNYNDMELFCGGFYKQYQVNGGRCGICGDPWEGPRQNEAGGLYANGIIVRHYNQGEVIKVKVELTANHKGYFQFRICPATDDAVEVTQECLDSYTLKLADGSGTSYYLPEGSGNGVFEVALQLPYQLQCDRCVFQWIYMAGNNWGICPDGSGKLGCGNQEQFRGCADVAIGLPNSVQTSSEHKHEMPHWHQSETHQPQHPIIFRHNQQHHYQSHEQHNQKQSHEEQHNGHQQQQQMLSCTAAGPWTDDGQMTKWCNDNCNHDPPFCPPSHCKCQE